MRIAKNLKEKLTNPNPPHTNTCHNLKYAELTDWIRSSLFLHTHSSVHEYFLELLLPLVKTTIIHKTNFMVILLLSTYTFLLPHASGINFPEQPPP